MSPTAATQSAAPAAGTSLRLRIVAVAVVVALAGLAAYTMFSGPTRVGVQGPSATSPSQTVPAPGKREPEGGGGERGD